jgi:predicted metalloprotease with PDZ domain
VSIVNGKGQPLAATRPEPHQWDVADHDGTVVVAYKVFGDRTDGTYLGVNEVHAHINIPAALMFARGWFERPARVRFVPPPGEQWKVATQLFPTADPLSFTAPNIHYLMDSPADFSRQQSGLRSHTMAPRPKPMRSPRTSSASSAKPFPSSASCRSSRPIPTRFSAPICRGPAATAWNTATAPR